MPPEVDPDAGFTDIGRFPPEAQPCKQNSDEAPAAQASGMVIAPRAVMLTRLTKRVPVLFKSVLARKLDATELLIQDHMKVESLLLQIKLLSFVAVLVPSRSSGEVRNRRQLLLEQVRADLETHMGAEEAVFYPECSKIGSLAEKFQHAREEHDETRSILDELSVFADDNDAFNSKLNELISSINHHVHDEEADVFPQVRRAMSHTRLERMASQMRAVKKSKKTEVAA